MTICRSLITPCSELFGSWSGRAAWVLLFAALLLWTPLAASAKSKPHRAPRPEPELKILDLNVSSLITSPSKNSFRFLTTRKPLEPHAASTDGAAPPQVSVLLTWDGLDQKKNPSGAGLYQFEVRAKLLANGEKGPRTQMVAWPKRGTVEVK